MNKDKLEIKKPLKAKVVKSRSGKTVVNLRRLKITSQSVACKNSWNGLKQIPFLRITGDWLNHVGFAIDSKVDIIVDNNLLVIKPAEV